MTELMEVTPKFYITNIYNCETQCEPVPCKEEWEPCIKTKPISTGEEGGVCRRVITEKIICYEKKKSKKRCPTPSSSSCSSSSSCTSEEDECTSQTESCTPQTESCSTAWLSVCEDDSGLKKTTIRKPKY